MHEATCIEQSLISRAGAVIKRLAYCKLTIITAESCTGGLISAVLSQDEDAGGVLRGSFVTYTKANKTKALGVDADLLKPEGNVTAEGVNQLACGALDRSPDDLAIAVSGVLGPSPDEDGNPVGLVYFACCRRNQRSQTECKDYGNKPHDTLRRMVVFDAMPPVERCAV